MYTELYDTFKPKQYGGCEWVSERVTWSRHFNSINCKFSNSVVCRSVSTIVVGYWNVYYVFAKFISSETYPRYYYIVIVEYWELCNAKGLPTAATLWPVTGCLNCMWAGFTMLLLFTSMNIENESNWFCLPHPFILKRQYVIYLKIRNADWHQICAFMTSVSVIIDLR